jgi:hypothetical protein
VKGVNTKLTEADYAACLECAAPEVWEWAREVLPAATTRRPIEELLLAEVLAERSIVIHLLLAVATHGPPPHEQMQELIDRIDREKTRRAVDRLTRARRP